MTEDLIYILSIFNFRYILLYPFRSLLLKNALFYIILKIKIILLVFRLIIFGYGLIYNGKF